MQPRLSSKHNAGMTLFEVGVVIAIVVILAAVFLPTFTRKHVQATRIVCINNLKQLNLAYRIWEGDNGDIFPMGISITNGGSMEMAQAGNVVQSYLVMSNELSTARILACPADTEKHWTNNFAGLSSSNLSYFVPVDMTNDVNPQELMAGDANFVAGGRPVEAGLRAFWTNDPVSWGTNRHDAVGNIGTADGSVRQTTSSYLHQTMVEAGVATNRLAIP